MRNTIIIPPNSDTVLIKVKPQPNSIFDVKETKYVKWKGINYPYHEFCERYAPYSIGQVVAVRETWANRLVLFGDEYHKGYAYRSDEHKDTRYFWRSPATMPLSACRKWGEITAVDVVEKDGVFYWSIGTKPHTK